MISQCVQPTSKGRKDKSKAILDQYIADLQKVVCRQKEAVKNSKNNEQN